MSGWSAQAMRELGTRHAALEGRQDLEGTMATLVADPVYELHPLRLRMRGRERVRRYYVHLFSRFMPLARSNAIIAEWVSPSALAQEYEIELEVEGRRERHRIIGILEGRDGRMTGERLFAGERLLRLMLGDLLDELEPLA